MIKHIPVDHCTFCETKLAEETPGRLTCRNAACKMNGKVVCVTYSGDPSTDPALFGSIRRGFALPPTP